MWANKEIVDLVEWLRSHNLEAEKKKRKWDSTALTSTAYGNRLMQS
jgi:erythromycin esterase-like protein